MQSLFHNHFTSQQRLWILGICLIWGGLLAWVAAGTAMQPFNELDEKLYQAWARQRVNKIDPSIDTRGGAFEEIVVVNIDDESLAQHSWPLPRSTYLEIVRRLEKAGATTIGFDILFLDRGPDPAQDAALAEALSHPTVVIPYVLEAGADRLLPRLPYPPLTADWNDEDFQSRLGFTADWRHGARRAVPLHVQDRPTNPDGSPILEDGEPIVKDYYALATTVLAHHRQRNREDVLTGLPLSAHDAQVEGLVVRFEGLTINYAAAGFGELLLPGEASGVPSGLNPEYNVERRAHALDSLLPVVSLDVLLSAPEEELPNMFPMMADRFIALVGVTATAGYDQKVSLVGPISGLEMQTNALINMMLGNPLQETSPRDHALLILSTVLLIGLAGAFTSYKVSAGTAVVTLLGLYAMNYWAYAGGDFKSGGTLLPFFGPAIGVIFSQTFVSIYFHQTDKARMEKIIRMFKEVCPVHDLEGLLAGQGLQLGGEERELSILFSDLRGYTSFAEKLDSVTVLNTLNQYFGTVGHILERYGGLVFDYQGDAQMVVFGLLKESQPNHAAAACKAGAEMIATLNAMRIEWLKAGQNVPETGVGVCTGPVSFGVLGTQQHKQYVAIGDPTNTASRVQGKSAELDAPVLVAESTARRAGDAVILEELDEIYLKGKKEPLGVYRVCIDEMLERGIIEVRQASRRGPDAE